MPSSDSQEREKKKSSSLLGLESCHLRTNATERMRAAGERVIVDDVSSLFSGDSFTLNSSIGKNVNIALYSQL